MEQPTLSIDATGSAGSLENQPETTTRTAIPRPPPVSNSTKPTGNIRSRQSSIPLPPISEISSSHENIINNTGNMAPSKIATKRELPQPVTQAASKRKALAERAGEFPSMSSRTARPAAASRASIAGTTLIGAASGLKPPNTRVRAPTTKTSALRSTYGISERPAAYERPKTAQGRPGPRTRSQSRPASALGTMPESATVVPPKKEEITAFDVDNRLVSMEQQFSQLKEVITESATDRSALETTIAMLKSRIAEQEAEKARHEQKIAELQTQLDKHRKESGQSKRLLEETIWKHKTEVEGLERANQHAREDLERKIQMETHKINTAHAENIESMKRRHEAELEEERELRTKQVTALEGRLANEHKDLTLEMAKKNEAAQDLKGQIELLKSEVSLGQSVKASLQANISEISASNATLEA